MMDGAGRYVVTNTKRTDRLPHNSLYADDNERYEVVVRYVMFDDYAALCEPQITF